jgi:hypothetical protein
MDRPDRLDRIEAAVERLPQQHEADVNEIRQLLKDSPKRHDDSYRLHESGLLDHDYALRELTAAMRSLITTQQNTEHRTQNTEHKLQAFIDSLRGARNGRK